MKKYGLVNRLFTAVSSISLALCLSLVAFNANAIPILSLDFGNGPIEAGWVGYGDGLADAALAPGSETYGGLTVSVASTGRQNVIDRGSYGGTGTSKNMFRDFIYSNQSTDLTVSITGLTAGQAYFLEIWSTDTLHSTPTVTEFTVGGVMNSVSNSSELPTGLGDILHMTTFNTSANGSGMLELVTAAKGASDQLGEAVRINGLRLTAVPEPTTVLLLALGLAGIGFIRRKAA